MSEEQKAISQYKVEGRQALLARVAKGASTAIETLIAASKEGDVRASDIILKKVLPDLKAVDISNSGEGAKIIINQKIYQGRGKNAKQIEMPCVTINVTEKKKQYQEIDITDSVTVSEPPKADAYNHSADRKKGIYR